MIRILKLIGAIAVAALVVGLAIALAVTRSRARAAAFRADSLEAVADTTKRIAGAWERRATQGELKVSALDEALKAKPKVVIRTVVKVTPIAGDSAPGTGVIEVDSLRIDSLKIRQAPVTLVVEAKLPPAPAKGRFSYRLGIDPLPIIPRVSCSSDLFNGIHRAYVALDSLPSWATAEIRDAQAEADVCNPRRGISIGVKLPWWTLPLAGGVGFAAGWLSHGRAAP